MSAENYKKLPDSDPAWCGLKDDPNFAQCCCNCQYHKRVYFHCTTEPKPTAEQKASAGRDGRCVCGVPKGWVCAMPEHDRVYDNWPEHSVGCECYTPIEPSPFQPQTLSADT